MARSPNSIPVTPAIARWEMLGWQQQSGRMTRYWADLIERDPFLESVVMVVEMVFGGRTGGATVVRVATEPVFSVSELAGTRHDAQPKLMAQPDLEQSYQLGVGSSAARSLAFTLDPALIDPVALVQRGIPLAGVAEVSLEPVGELANHDRRYVLLRGDIDGAVRFGASSGQERELMELEVVDPRTSVGTKLPPWVMDSSRFSTIHPSAVGQRIPLVINAFTIPCPRITVLLTGVNDFVIAYGHGWSATPTVYVNGVSYLTADVVYGWSIVEANDSTGTPYTYISFTNVGTAWADTDAVHVVTTHDTDGYGVIGVIDHVLRNFSALGESGVNASLVAESIAKLGVTDEPKVLVNAASGGGATNALEWVEGGYLAQFPMISMVWEGGRYGPIVTDFRTTPLAQWTAGSLPLLDRVSLVEETAKANIRNNFVIRYDYDPIEDLFLKVAIRDCNSSDVCAYSAQVFGEIHADPIEAPYIDTDSLASYVLDWLVAHQALPSYLVEYTAVPALALTHRRGDTIELTDAELGWANTPATIEGITFNRGHATIRFRVWARFLDLGGASMSV